MLVVTLKYIFKSNMYSVQFSSVTQSCPTLCNPMNRSTPGLPVHHQFPEFTQTHIHQVGDAIQPSHPLLSPFLLPPIPPSIRVFSNESTQDPSPWEWTGWVSLMFLNCGVGEDSWESLGLQGDPTSPFWRRSVLGFLWKEWC